MGFEREALSELYASVWGNRSKMQKEFARGAHGEPFILHELALRGTMTPSQLASSLKASSGRISTVLAALEKKRVDHPRHRPGRPPHHPREPYGCWVRAVQVRLGGDAFGNLLDLLADGGAAHARVR